MSRRVESMPPRMIIVTPYNPLRSSICCAATLIYLFRKRHNTNDHIVISSIFL